MKLSTEKNDVIWLGRWVRWASLPVFVTGVVYLWMKYFMKGDDPYSVLHHPLQPFFLKAHILFAPILLIVLGGMIFIHALPSVAAGKGKAKKSGWWNLLFVGAMVFSGYLLQVFTNEKTLSVTAIVHIVCGFLFVLTLLIHQWAARK